ncbi:MAG: hypothetical protein ACI4RU_01545, partial [Acutalibacteraceae bacterium]
KIQQNGPVFHDLPEDGGEGEKTTAELSKEASMSENPPKRTPQISEEEALRSFPDFDFDMSIFEAEENGGDSSETDEPLSEKEALKAHKAKAKLELKAEKEKIKTQHKLENKVQKPFRQRRILAFFMVLFMLFGFIATALTAALYLTDTTPEATLHVGNYSILFVDGTNIKSTNYENKIVILKNESVKSSKPVLFAANDSLRIEEIVAIGDGVCAVNISNRIVAVSTDDIESVVSFSVGGIRSLYKIIRSEIYKVAIGFGIYFAAAIIFFSALIIMKNRKIKKYRESYELIG